MLLRLLHERGGEGAHQSLRAGAGGHAGEGGGARARCAPLVIAGEEQRKGVAPCPRAVGAERQVGTLRHQCQGDSGWCPDVTSTHGVQ